MSAKSSLHNQYVGPRALFDPYYIPPNLFGLKKEQHSMQTILNDAIQDRYPLILSLYGLRGVGKTSLTRKIVANLQISQKSNSKESDRIELCYVNCEEKEFDQIVFSMINSLSRSQNFELPPESILNATMERQINLLTHLMSKSMKSEASLLFLLDSIEYTPPSLINKLMDVCISQSCVLVTSFNFLKNSPHIMEFKKPNVQIQLNTYTPTLLEKICANRCNLAFRHPIEPVIIKYVTDLVSTFDYCVPESCVRMLRELYPLLESNLITDSGQIQDVCRFQFNRYSIDELNIAEFISETDIVDRLALDEISSFFHSQRQYYIKYSELINMYKIACEHIEYEFYQSHFMEFLTKLERIGLLQPSQFSQNSYQKLNPPTQKSHDALYFLSISPQMFLEILDASFGLVDYD